MKKGICKTASLGLAVVLAGRLVSRPAFATGGDLYAKGTGYCASTYPGHPTLSGFGPAVDINADAGDYRRPVYAPETGTVSVYSTGWGGGWGNSIIWRSANGSERIHVAHLDEIRKTGSVQGGDLIALAGSTGYSTGAHLHVARSVNGGPATLVLSGRTILAGRYPPYCDYHYVSAGPIIPPGIPTQPAISETHTGGVWSTHPHPRWAWSASVTNGYVLRYEVAPSWAPGFLTTAVEYHPALPSGTYSVRVRAQNNAQVWGPWSVLVTARVDVTPPSTVAQVAGEQAESGWFRSPATVALTASDAHSGVRTTETGTGPYSAPIELPEGRHSISYRSIDAVSNEEPWRSADVNVDLGDPTAEMLTPDKTVFLTPVTPDEVSAQAADPALADESPGSGLTSVCFAVTRVDATGRSDLGCRPADTLVEGIARATLGLDTGTYEVAARATDVAGRQGPPGHTIDIVVVRAA